MSKKTTVFYSSLLHKARALETARKSGDPDSIAKAQKDHDEYADLCNNPNVILRMDVRVRTS